MQQKKNFWGQRTIKIWDVDVDNIVFSKSIETKSCSKHLIVYLDDLIRPIVWILPKIKGYIKSFKDRDGDKDKNKNDKLMSFRIDDNKLLERHKTVWTKTKVCI